MIKGTTMLLRLNGKLVAHSKELDIDLSQEYLNAASEYTRTRKIIPTDYSVVINTSCLVAEWDEFIELKDAYENGTEVSAILWFIGGATYEQKVQIASISASGNVGETVKMKVSLAGSGRIEKRGDVIPYLEVYPLSHIFRSSGDTKDEYIYSNTYWNIN